MPATNLTDDRLLKPKEVMPLLRFTDRSAFWAFCRRNAVPFIQASPRRPLFSEAALRAWMEARTIGQSS